MVRAAQASLEVIDLVHVAGDVLDQLGRAAEVLDLVAGVGQVLDQLGG